MSEAEKKDKILSFLNIEENRNGFFQTADLSNLVFKEETVSYDEIRYLVKCLEEDGYLFYSAPSCKYLYPTTPFLESGGYEAQEESLKLEKEEERKKDEASYQKTLNEGKLAKWQVKIFWPAFIFTLVGSILGIISFYLQVRK
jgi:hypothetical protein